MRVVWTAVTTWTNASPDEAWLVGFDDAYRGAAYNPPVDSILEAEYAQGWAAGKVRLAKENKRNEAESETNDSRRNAISNPAERR